MRACVAVLSALVLATAGTAQDPQQKEPQGQQKAEARKNAAEQETDAERLKAVKALQLVRTRNLLPAKQEPAAQPLQLAQPMQLNLQANGVRFLQLGHGIALATGTPAPESYAAKVPAAQESLTEIQQALQAALAAEDQKAVLEALDRMERAIMKTRAAVHAAGEAKTPQAAEPGDKGK